jgi:hypothetical protein
MDSVLSLGTFCSADVIDDEGYEKLRREAPKQLSQFVLPDGSVEFEAPAHIVTVTA